LIGEVLRGYPGEREVLFAVKRINGEVVHIKAGSQRVAIDADLRRRLDELLGENSHRLIFQKPKAKTRSQSEGRGRWSSKG
jgi:DNA polymerase-3 subunit alpha